MEDICVNHKSEGGNNTQYDVPLESCRVLSLQLWAIIVGQCMQILHSPNQITKEP